MCWLWMLVTSRNGRRGDGSTRSRRFAGGMLVVRMCVGVDGDVGVKVLGMVMLWFVEVELLKVGVCLRVWRMFGCNGGVGRLVRESTRVWMLGFCVLLKCYSLILLLL